MGLQILTFRILHHAGKEVLGVFKHTLASDFFIYFLLLLLFFFFGGGRGLLACLLERSAMYKDTATH